VSPLDLDQARHQAVGTAAVVRSLANETRRLASVENNSRSELAGLAVLTESLAEEAQSAAEAIDCCPRSAGQTMQDSRSVALSRAALEVCTKLTATLQEIFDTVVNIYADACAKLADHVALAEEHRPSSPAPHQTGITAAVLGAHARGLRNA
jgi:hypothetical protein